MKRIRLGVRGFTLIELLVVVAIIGLLAATVVSMVAKGMEKAYESGCSNNLRQLAVAMTIMTDGWRPYPKVGGESYYGSQPDLLDELRPLLSGDDKVLFCPRAARLEGVKIRDEVQARRLGYFYWGWKLEGDGVLRPDETNNVWVAQGWNQHLVQTVLFSDHFRDRNAWALESDWQFHGDRDVRKGLDQPGTLVGLQDGSVHKVAPRP